MTDNEWPLEADFSDIRPMTPEERKAAQERDERNSKSNDKQPVEEANSSRASTQGERNARPRVQ